MSKDNEFTQGVLYSKKSEENYALTRVKPIGRLSELIETYWLVTWDLPDNLPHTQQNIPDPCINMVFEAQNSRIVGAVTKLYSVQLAGKGRIFGIKFHVGGFYELNNLPASNFTDKSTKIDDIFGADSHDLIENVLAANDIAPMIQFSENFLLPLIPGRLNSVNKISEIIHEIERDQTITRVDQLSAKFDVSIRSLQRLFNQQVGVSPKWVIRKYRMREVLNRLEKGEYNWQELIVHLDYFDQSHFVKDFKNLVGVTPSDYINFLRIA